jgi:5-formyltetrahydrofolate cyclo-ligase
MSKHEIRSLIKQKLNVLSPAELSGMSAAVADRLYSLREWSDAGLILAYRSMEREADTRPVIAAALAAGKRVFLPRVDGKELVFHLIRDLSEASVRHPYGMREPPPELPRLALPLPAGARVLVLVPGLAFDRERNRLGRGKGYYDRFLRDLSARAGEARVFLLGLGFRLQLFDALPHTPADVRLDAVLTDEETVR